MSFVEGVNMIKIINSEYYINNNDVFYGKDKIVPTRGLYKIKIGTKNRYKNFNWLQNVAALKIPLDEEILDNLYFLPHKPFGVSRDFNFMPVYKKPIYVGGIYRKIPRFPKYAISMHGEIVSVSSLNSIKIIEPIFLTYKKAHIVDQSNNKIRFIGVHRLVAMAWVSNNDYVNNNIIDHINNDKNDNFYKNLKWVSNRHNVHKVVLPNSKGYLVRNSISGVITHFNTISEVSKFIGRKSKIDVARRPLVPGLLWRGKCGSFEIQEKMKNNVWKYNDAVINRYIYVLKFNNRTIPDTYFPTIHLLIRYLNLEKNTTLEDINLYIVKNKLPFKIEIIYGSGGISIKTAKNIKTGEIVERNTARELSLATGLPKSTIIKYLNLGIDDLIINGWLIRHKIDLPWADDINILRTPKIYNKKVYYTTVSGEVTEFYSTHEASKKIGYSQGTIVKKINKNIIVKYNNTIGYLSYSPLYREQI